MELPKNTVTIYAFKELIDFLFMMRNGFLICKKTFNGAQSVIDYLGKYTHRICHQQSPHHLYGR